MAAVLLIGSVMKFAIALFSAAHAPSSRRALLFAQAALAGGHEIVRRPPSGVPVRGRGQDQAGTVQSNACR